MRQALLLLALSLTACDGGASTETPVTSSTEDIGEQLATVNGTPIGSKAFQQLAARKSPESGDELSDDERRDVLDRLIAEEVLYLEALRRELDKDPKVRKVMVNTLLREQVYANVRNSDFSDEELQAYYDAHQDEFVTPEKIQIKRVLIRITDDRPDADAKALAERVRDELTADLEAFGEVATKYSEDGYKRRGGDIGFVAADGKPGLDQEIVDKAFELDTGELSEVFRSIDGYNIVYVPIKRERVERTFQQMKGSVLRKVKNERLESLFDEYVDSLKEGLDIKVNADQLGAVEVKNMRRAMPAPGSPIAPDAEGGAATAPKIPLPPGMAAPGMGAGLQVPDDDDGAEDEEQDEPSQDEEE